jgi:hypothetical protein
LDVLKQLVFSRKTNVWELFLGLLAIKNGVLRARSLF